MEPVLLNVQLVSQTYDVPVEPEVLPKFIVTAAADGKSKVQFSIASMTAPVPLPARVIMQATLLFVPPFTVIPETYTIAEFVEAIENA